MNKIMIDLDAVKLVDWFDEKSGASVVSIGDLTNCEVKPDSCADCYWLNTLKERPCIYCSIEKTPHFKPKECNHDWLYSTSGKVDARRKCNKCKLMQWSKFND